MSDVSYVSIKVCLDLYAVVENEAQWLFDEQGKCCETVRSTFVKRLMFNKV